MFQLLLEYKAQHGNTSVSQNYDKNPRLANWVGTQRFMHAKKQLLSHRVSRLESIGFAWSCRKNVSWESMFRLLLEYKAQHGNTLVPRNYDKSPRLGNWVNEQRCLHARKQLLSNRVLLLESIGFAFNAKDENWMRRFHQLCSYALKHGSTTVPQRWTEDPSFGSWVRTQQHQCTKKERVKLLNAIGFVWGRRK
mmetsp:Transcript_24738/g.54292  ORF Transcript_24738/g.54292 Transcript_24738/m.54292 type:complete len:194 (-) Transcript_24738:587-1168(-)